MHLKFLNDVNVGIVACAPLIGCPPQKKPEFFNLTKNTPRLRNDLANDR